VLGIVPTLSACIKGDLKAGTVNKWVDEIQMDLLGTVNRSSKTSVLRTDILKVDPCKSID
jgi:hypothetical protein